MRSNLSLFPLALLLLVAVLALPAAASADTGTTVPLSATQGKAFDGTVANFSEVDDHYFDTGPSALIKWGDGTSSVGKVTGDRQAQKWSVAGTHTYAKSGNFQVVVTLDWHDAEMPRETVAAGPISVASGLAPIGTTLRTPFGAPFSGHIGSFRDDRTGATADRTKFSAKVDWGDGTPQTPAEIESAGGTTFRLVSGHSWAQAGYYTVRATVTSTDGAATTVVETTAIVTGDPKPSVTTDGRPCADVPVTFRSTTTPSPGAEIVSHQWKIEDPSAFGAKGPAVVDTGSTPTLTRTFGYSSVELGLGSDDTPAPDLPLRLHRNPVTVTLTVVDATGETRTTTRTVTFADDNYKPTEAAPTPAGCGKSVLSGLSLTAVSSAIKVAKTGSFKFSAGCPKPTDCMARVTLVPLPGGGAPRTAAASAKRTVLGSGVAFLRSGTSGSIPVRLSRSGRALLQAKGRLRAQLVVTSLAGGARTTTSRTITLAR